MVLRGDDGKRWDGGKKEVAIRRSLESRPNQFGVPPGTSPGRGSLGCRKRGKKQTQQFETDNTPGG